MRCPICTALLHSDVWENRTCLSCKVYSRTAGSVTYLLAHCYTTGEWLLSGDILRSQITTELQKLVQHSEWSRWRDTPNLHTDPFIQSLFADWCADNGFPLQEQAVRQRLQEAEGR